MRLLILLLTLGLFCSPVFAEGPPPPGPKDRCEVCGMFVAPYRDWVAVLQMIDGSNHYFDGPKDLFIYYMGLAKYQPGASYDQVAGLYVTEYYTAKLMPASEVLFVTGSDVLGPMGKELVPVAGREAAETFLRDHAGQKLMRFDGRELQDVTDQP